MENIIARLEKEELINILATENEAQYNMMKVIEENLELSEILVKKINKVGREKEPKEQEIIDEIGDCFIRLRILAEMYGFDKVQERINSKLGRLDKWYRSEQFKGNC